MPRPSVAILLALALGAATPAAAVELTVLCPRGVQAPMTALAERFEAETAHRLRFAFGTAGMVARRAAEGHAADVVITAAHAIDDLLARGIARPGSRLVIGSVGVGIAVKRGAAVPDVSTPAALRTALLATPSLGYADPARGGQGGTHFAGVVERLGLTETLRARTRLFPEGLQALESVAAGEVALAAAPVSEILPLKGLALAGPLPPSLQARLVYAAALLATSRAPEEGQALLAFLATPAARAILARGGLEAE